jgi:hypothetical protein
MMTPEEERRWAHFNRPLWDSLSLADEDPYGGLFGTADDNRRGRRACQNCGAWVLDRGLHYRFHVQLAQMFALLKIQGEREILSTITDEDETVEILDSDGNVVATFALGHGPDE